MHLCGMGRESFVVELITDFAFFLGSLVFSGRGADDWSAFLVEVRINGYLETPPPPRKSRGGVGGEKRSNPWFLRIGAVLLLIALVALGLVLQDPARKPQENSEPVEPDALAAYRHVAESFLGTSDPDERLRWVRNAEAVKTRLDSFAAEALRSKGTIQRVLEHHENNGWLNTGFLVRFDTGSHRLLEVAGPVDALRVDWDAYARYGTASWVDVREGKVKRAVARVHCKPSLETPPPFTDSDAWTGFEMSSQDYQGTVLAFAAVGEPREAIMKRIVLATKGYRRRFTLEIVQRSEGDQPLYEIERCLAVGWVVNGDLEAKWMEQQNERGKQGHPARENIDIKGWYFSEQ